MRALIAFVVIYPSLLGVLFALLFSFARYFAVPKDQKRTEWFIIAAALAIPANIAAEAVTKWISILRPLKYDLYIFHIDGLLGFQPSFSIGRLTSSHLWLEMLASFGYGALSLAMLAVFAAYLWRRPQAQAIALFKTFALNLCASLPIYLLIPVSGPQFAFQQFPTVIPHVVAHPIFLSTPPNGIPSVHFSTALLIAWYARHWLLGRLLGIVYVVIMGIATLGSGQHYLVDLLLAIPYAIAVYRVCNPGSAAVRSARRFSTGGDTTGVPPIYVFDRSTMRDASWRVAQDTPLAAATATAPGTGTAPLSQQSNTPMDK